MPFYHVRIFHLTKNEHPLVKEDYQLNLSKTFVEKAIIEPYIGNRPLRFGSLVLYPEQIAEIQINKTAYMAYFLSPEMRDSYSSASDDCFTVTKGETLGEVVTSRFVSEKRMGAKSPLISKKNVFIVHGRDHTPMKELRTMLEEFGLNPIVLHEQPSGSRTIVEKLEKYSDVGYAFAILTPDDVGCSDATLKEEVLIDVTSFTTVPEGPWYSDPRLRRALKLRARQNVILEFGYFIGLLGRDRVCCLYKGDVELPSDMRGIVYIPFKKSVKEVRHKIIKELKEAGYVIKM